MSRYHRIAFILGVVALIIVILTLGAATEGASTDQRGIPFAEADGEPPWDFTHTFAAAVKRAGIHDLHFHDLRHTWASRLAIAGVDLLTIKKLGGWKTLLMVQRYAHLSPDHKRQAIERVQVAATFSDPGVSQSLSAAAAAT